MAYNTSVNPTTSHSPFYLMFGRQARMSIDVTYSQPGEDLSPQKHVAELQKLLESAFYRVKEQIGHKLDRQKAFYDKRIHGKPYAEGELVWLHSPVVSKSQGRKLHRPRTGPFKLVRKLSDVTYRIQHTKQDSNG